MKIKNKISIELLDWLREELESKNTVVDFKKLRLILKIAIKHNKKYNRIFTPSSFYKFNVNENKLYYYYNYHCDAGVIKENYEVILK